MWQDGKQGDIPGENVSERNGWVIRGSRRERDSQQVKEEAGSWGEGR